jgi:glycosyltransferase involved in cell wall biosynthesis
MIASRVAGFGIVKDFDERAESAGETRVPEASAPGKGRKIAIVHDWLPVYAGAERVLEQMLYIFPEADVFSILDFIPDGERGFLQNKKVKTSFVQRLPWVKRKYRSYLPIMPLAIEQLDVSGYDLVISSSYAVAKGVITGPDQLHICYCHSPIRYAWDLQNQYLSEAGLTGFRGMLARILLHYIRMWDLRTSHGVNSFIANSQFIARRIRKVYGRESEVIYPPVNTGAFSPNGEKQDFYLTVSRMVPYKRVDMIVEAFSQMPDKKLIVIGDGPDFKRIKASAGPNVQMLGYQYADALVSYMQHAKAVVFAAEEDFGIVPVEAQACGTPVIAFGKGGVMETVIPGETGVFYHEQTASSLCEAVKAFEENGGRICAERCRRHADRFSIERFRLQFETFVEREWAAFKVATAAEESYGEVHLAVQAAEPVQAAG